MKTITPRMTSHTATCAHDALSTATHICAAASISRDDWRLLLFELGCKWAEQQAHTQELALLWLTKPHFEFWQNWLVEYLDDDQWLLGFKNKFSPEEYKHLKTQYLELRINEKV